MFYEVILDNDTTARFFKTKDEAYLYLLSRYFDDVEYITLAEYKHMLTHDEIEDFGGIFTAEFEDECRKREENK